MIPFTVEGFDHLRSTVDDVTELICRFVGFEGTIIIKVKLVLPLLLQMKRFSLSKEIYFTEFQNKQVHALFKTTNHIRRQNINHVRRQDPLDLLQAIRKKILFEDQSYTYSG